MLWIDTSENDDEGIILASRKGYRDCGGSWIENCNCSYVCVDTI